MPTLPTLLDARAAKQCAGRIHNDRDATIAAEPGASSPYQQIVETGAGSVAKAQGDSEPCLR